MESLNTWGAYKNMQLKMVSNLVKAHFPNNQRTQFHTSFPLFKINSDSDAIKFIEEAADSVVFPSE